jgi:uncharacterized membrane protein
MLRRVAVLITTVMIGFLVVATPLRAAGTAPASGITASGLQIRTAFESRFGLRFSPVPLRDGRRRLVAEDKRNLRSVEIIGSEDRVTSVSAIVFSTAIAPALVARGTLLATLLDVAAPEWKSGPHWVAAHLAKADDYVEGAMQQGTLEISLKIARPLGMTTITVASRTAESGRSSRAATQPSAPDTSTDSAKQTASYYLPEEYLARHGLSREVAVAAELRCHTAIRDRFKTPQAILTVSVEGYIRKLADGSYRQYGRVLLPNRGFAWSCALEPDLSRVRRLAVLPQCKGQEMTFEDGTLDLKTRPTHCIDGSIHRSDSLDGPFRSVR